MAESVSTEYESDFEVTSSGDEATPKKAKSPPAASPTKKSVVMSPRGSPTKRPVVQGVMRPRAGSSSSASSTTSSEGEAAPTGTGVDPTEAAADSTTDAAAVPPPPKATSSSTSSEASSSPPTPPPAPATTTQVKVWSASSDTSSSPPSPPPPPPPAELPEKGEPVAGNAEVEVTTVTATEPVVQSLDEVGELSVSGSSSETTDAEEEEASETESDTHGAGTLSTSQYGGIGDMTAENRASFSLVVEREGDDEPVLVASSNPELAPTPVKETGPTRNEVATEQLGAGSDLNSGGRFDAVEDFEPIEEFAGGEGKAPAASPPSDPLAETKSVNPDDQAPPTASPPPAAAPTTTTTTTTVDPLEAIRRQMANDGILSAPEPVAQPPPSQGGPQRDEVVEEDIVEEFIAEEVEDEPLEAPPPPPPAPTAAPESGARGDETAAAMRSGAAQQDDVTTVEAIGGGKMSAPSSLENSGRAGAVEAPPPPHDSRRSSDASSVAPAGSTVFTHETADFNIVVHEATPLLQAPRMNYDVVAAEAENQQQATSDAEAALAMSNTLVVSPCGGNATVQKRAGLAGKTRTPPIAPLPTPVEEPAPPPAALPPNATDGQGVEEDIVEEFIAEEVEDEPLEAPPPPSAAPTAAPESTTPPAPVSPPPAAAAAATTATQSINEKYGISAAPFGGPTRRPPRPPLLGGVQATNQQQQPQQAANPFAPQPTHVARSTPPQSSVPASSVAVEPAAAETTAPTTPVEETVVEVHDNVGPSGFNRSLGGTRGGGGGSRRTMTPIDQMVETPSVISPTVTATTTAQGDVAPPEEIPQLKDTEDKPAEGFFMTGADIEEKPVAPRDGARVTLTEGDSPPPQTFEIGGLRLKRTSLAPTTEKPAQQPPQGPQQRGSVVQERRKPPAVSAPVSPEPTRKAHPKPRRRVVSTRRPQTDDGRPAIRGQEAWMARHNARHIRPVILSAQQEDQLVANNLAYQQSQLGQKLRQRVQEAQREFDARMDSEIDRLKAIVEGGGASAAAKDETAPDASVTAKKKNVFGGYGPLMVLDSATHDFIVGGEVRATKIPGHFKKTLRKTKPAFH